MATAPKPSFNFHARIDCDTEERRRRLQERTGFSAPLLVRAAFHESAVKNPISDGFELGG